MSMGGRRTRRIARLPGSLPPLIYIIALAGCAAVQPAPPEQRTTTVQVKVPVVLPCFTESERPVLPPPTPIDWQTATTLQLAAADLADGENLRLFAEAYNRLFIRCTQSTQGVPK